MADLILNVTKYWFDKIKSGKKSVEYREVKPYWTNRLNKNFDNVIIVKGYPKIRNDTNSIIFPWRGFIICNLDKDMLSYDKVVDTLKMNSGDVYAIKLEV